MAEHRCRGKWSYVVDAGRDATGRRRQLTRGGYATRTEARAALREVLLAGSARDIESHRLTVGSYLEQWLDGKRALRPSTRKSYREHLDLYLLPHLGHLRLRNLAAPHIDGMINAIASDGGKHLSPTTIRRIHATLRSALNAAMRRQMISVNPALQVELPRQDRKAAAVWTPAQLSKFLTAIRTDRLYALYHLVALTGLRRGEVLGLRWSDADLERQLLFINQQVVQVGRTTHIGPPKTSKGRRVVPLDAGTAALLELHRRDQQRERQDWGSGLDRFRDGVHQRRRHAAQPGLPHPPLQGTRQDRRRPADPVSRATAHQRQPRTRGRRRNESRQ